MRSAAAVVVPTRREDGAGCVQNDCTRCDEGVVECNEAARRRSSSSATDGFRDHTRSATGARVAGRRPANGAQLNGAPRGVSMDVGRALRYIPPLGSLQEWRAHRSACSTFPGIQSNVPCEVLHTHRQMHELQRDLLLRAEAIASGRRVVHEIHTGKLR